jgi:Ca2+-transporting ATPase
VDTAEGEDLDEGIAYHVNIDELCAQLATDQHRGLSEAEARFRLTHYGPNELAAEKPISSWRRFLAQFQDVLVILLLVATGVSAALWAFERDAALPY